MNHSIIWAAVGWGLVAVTGCDTASVEPIDGGNSGGTAGHAGEPSGGDPGTGVSGGTGDSDGTATAAGADGSAGTTAGEPGAGGTSDGGFGGTATAGSGGTAGGSSFPTTWDGSMPNDGICTPQGWCWVYPNVPYFQYTSLAASGPNDAWALSKGVGLIHSNGTRWNGILDDIDGLVGTSSATDAWLVQEPAHQIRHWNGTIWSAPADLPASGTIRAIWPRNAGDAWLVGDTGTVLHFDGLSWAAVSATDRSHDLKAVHGTAANDVWIGGTTGASGNAVRHYNGTAWTDAPVTTDVATLCATSSTEVLTGGSGHILRYNGSLWAEPPNEPSVKDTSNATNCAASPTGQVFFNGSFGIRRSYIWSGTSLAPALSTQGAANMPLAFDSAFLVAQSMFEVVPGTMPSLWRLADSPALDHPSIGTFPYGTYADSDKAFDILPFADEDVLLFTTNGTWRGTIGGALAQRSDICTKGAGVYQPPVCGGHNLSVPTRVFGRAINDFWAVDEATSYVLHWDGAVWTRSFVGGEVKQVVSTTSDTWARSGTQLYHYNGAALWDVATGAPAADYVQGGIATEAFAITSTDSSVKHWTGSAWAALPAFPDAQHQPVLCAASSAAGHLKVVTQDGIYDYDGTSWSSKAGLAIGQCGIHNDTVVAAGAVFDGANWHQSTLPVNVGISELKWTPKFGPAAKVVLDGACS